MLLRMFAGTLSVALLLFQSAQAGMSPQKTCEARKNRAAGRFADCNSVTQRHRINGNTEKWTRAAERCQSKLEKTWKRIERRAAVAGSPCLTTGDEGAISSFQGSCTQAVADALAGAPLAKDPISCTELLEFALLCPATGLAGFYGFGMNPPNQVCAGQLTQYGSSLTLELDCFGLGPVTLTGNVRNKTITFQEENSALCGGEAFAATIELENNCSRGSGTFSCPSSEGSIGISR